MAVIMQVFIPYLFIHSGTHCLGMRLMKHVIDTHPRVGHHGNYRHDILYMTEIMMRPGGLL